MRELLDSSWVVVIEDPLDLGRYENARKHGDLAAAGIELRMDLWRSERNLEALGPLPGATILTFREGPGTAQDERGSTLTRAARGLPGLDWIDLDHRDPLLNGILGLLSDESRGESGGGAGAAPRLILSAHLDHLPDADTVHQLEQRALAHPAIGALKLVLPAGHGVAGIEHAVRIAERPFTKPRTVFAAGVDGSASRALAVARGSAWSYARMPGRNGSDPGQPPLHETWTVEPGHAVYGVVGADVRESLSPGWHNRLLAGHDRPATFLPFSLPDLPALLASSEIELAGMAITTPHKFTARSLGAPWDEHAERYLAWNTLVRRAADWCGTNTDGPALVNLLHEHGSAPTTACILGAGGAAAGAATALVDAGHSVQILARDPDAVPPALRALATASKRDLPEVQVLVNATGGGPTQRSAVPWDLTRFRGTVHADYHYGASPPAHLLPTQHFISGLELFAEQARLQARRLYGIDVDAVRARELTALVAADRARDIA